jgi:hypothetical protein
VDPRGRNVEVVGSNLRDDVLHDLYSSSVIKLRRTWAGLVA